MESVSYAVTVALMALVPHLGGDQAKVYGDAVGRAATVHHVDPWMLVAIGRVETNWDASNMGDCCGGVMSIHWPGWRKVTRCGTSSDDGFADASAELARWDVHRNIALATEACLEYCVRPSSAGARWRPGTRGERVSERELSPECVRPPRCPHCGAVSRAIPSCRARTAGTRVSIGAIDSGRVHVWHAGETARADAGNGSGRAVGRDPCAARSGALFMRVPVRGARRRGRVV